jgi:hypothetical protein
MVAFYTGSFRHTIQIRQFIRPYIQRFNFRVAAAAAAVLCFCGFNEI